MKDKGLLSSALLVFVALNAWAQSSLQTPEARARELQSRYMTGVSAELMTKIDTKIAVAGQQIALKTKADVTLADGTSIPAGTKLAGRVVAAHPKSDEQGGAMLTITFDQAVLKGGKLLPVRSLIRTMGANLGAGPGVEPMARAADAEDASLDGTGMGGVARGSGSGGRAGGIGGGGATGGVGGPTRGGRQANPIGQTGPMGGATAPESTTQVDRRTVDAGESVTNRMRQTGVPGVLLATSPSDETSGTLVEYGRNIVLENGTQITLGLIAR